MEIVKKLAQHTWDFLESITFALGIFVVVFLFLGRPAVVSGSSSFPTIKTDEKVFLEKISYYLHPPQRGDFVILESLQNPEVDFVKRIIGLPGETIRISSSKVYINGNLLSEPYLSEDIVTGPESYLPENVEFNIPKDYFFVMGDNREHSSDSRNFGPIPASSIVGKVVWRFWPPDKFGPVQ